MIVLEGTAEATIEGKTETVAADSVAYFASNETHKSRDAGAMPSPELRAGTARRRCLICFERYSLICGLANTFKQLGLLG
jgi:hypothetical protein